MNFKFEVYKRPTLVDMGVDPVREELLNETRKAGREMKKDMELVFQTWEKKPQVIMKIHLTRADPKAGVEIYVQDELVQMLNQGTKGHFVTAREAPRMAWRVGFNPKTIPHQLRSVKGGKYGNVWATSKRHWVKGIEAREWDKALLEKWDKPLTDRLQAAANRGAAKARRI